MISGELRSAQELTELLSGLPGAKSGYLSVLSKNLFLSLRVENRKVKGFYANLEFRKPVPSSLLLYALAELMLDTEGYFSFEPESAIEEFLPADEELEGLVIRATILRKELDELLPFVITPAATLRSKDEKLDGRTLAEILVSSEDPVTEARRLKKLFEEKLVSVARMEESGSVEEIGLDYVLEGVEYGKVNLFPIVDSLKAQGFTGFVEIEGESERAYVFFKGGKIFGVYPASVKLFDLFLNAFGNLKASVVKIKEEFVETFAQAFVGTPAVESEDRYASLGKLFLTLLTLKERGTVKIESPEGSFVFIFQDGKLLSAKRKDRWSENWRVLFEEPFRVYLYKEVRPQNVKPLFYLFLINKLLHLLRKHGLERERIKLVEFVARKPNLYLDGSYVNPSAPLSKEDEEELFNLLVSVSDSLVKHLGRTRFEEELENELSPYKDVFKILELPDALKLEG
ncbi:MAG: hypothetical protein GXO03_00140 [Aquificae bacterium]|nr:hypothetical protein [Aquificota bacterium]